MEKTFKNYKEKQNYYREKAKEFKTIWESRDVPPIKGLLGKGRTYIKPKQK